MTPESVCCACLGVGASGYKEHHVGEHFEATTLGTNLCECRRMLPPREGEATWWTVETTFSRYVPSFGRDDAGVEVTVSPEVPVSEQNYRVQMRGNRYWPTTVRVEINGEDVDLFPHEARDLARTLLEAAMACDNIDDPCADICGHWAPCNCEHARQAR